MPSLVKPFSPADQLLAFALALLWIAAGVVGIVLGLHRGRWTALVVGIFALGYGIVWLRAARVGRRLTLAEALSLRKRSRTQARRNSAKTT